MGLYSRYLLPRLIDLAMRQEPVSRLRAAHVSRASGAVVEVGIGSGLNLPHYTRAVTRLHGVDPSPALLAMARTRAASAPFPVELVEGSAERLSCADGSADTVVVTWSLCSVPRPGVVLREARRVLKPGGALIFVEHGLAPDAAVRTWQNRLTPAWRHVAGGCHLNRDVVQLIRRAGFIIDELTEGYVPGPRPMTYMYGGHAHAGDTAGDHG